MSAYNRNTELRNVHTKDLYNLAVILDDDNYWQTLMEVIPLEINNQTFGTKEDLERISSGAAYERKYSNDHIRLIENAVRRPGESRLYSQILFDEWGSSGRKHERPTLGVLFHLLVQTKLYRAADFVAELLREPKPSRPSNGPAAEFEFELDVFNDIQEAVNDTRFYPNTEDLQDNFNIDINKDHYTKYHKTTNKEIPTVNDNIENPMTTAPTPPPRLLKSARLLKQQQKQQNHLLQHTANEGCKNLEGYTQQQLKLWSDKESVSTLSLSSTEYMPNLSALMDTPNNATIAHPLANKSTVNENVLPNLSALNNISDKITQEAQDYSLNSIPSLIFTKSNITEDYESEHSELNSLPILVLSKSFNSDSKKERVNAGNDTETHSLPVLTELNLNGEIDDLQSAKQNRLNNFENIRSNSVNFSGNQSGRFDEHAVNDDDVNLPSVIAYMNENQTQSRHQLESIEEDYNGIEHEHDNNIDAEIEDDEDSLPNLSFLDNRSSNNESSLTSVTNTSGDNSFEQSANDCSSTSTDNVPFLSVFNQ